MKKRVTITKVKKQKSELHLTVLGVLAIVAFGVAIFFLYASLTGFAVFNETNSTTNMIETTSNSTYIGIAAFVLGLVIAFSYMIEKRRK